jgi:hypothetical protein
MFCLAGKLRLHHAFNGKNTNRRARKREITIEIRPTTDLQQPASQGSEHRLNFFTIRDMLELIRQCVSFLAAMFRSRAALQAEKLALRKELVWLASSSRS